MVHPSLPVKSVKDLIALAKAKPGALNYGSSIIGGASHLAAELLKFMAGVNIVHVPYKGSAPAITALLSGEVQMLFESGGTLTPHIQSGRLKALAITTAKPSKLFPGLSTVATSGLPGFYVPNLNVIFTTAKTPEAIVNRLHHEIEQYLHRPEVQERFFNSGVEVVAGTPKDLTAVMKADLVKWAKVIKAANIHAD